MLEATQHQIVTEPSGFMAALIWLYLWVSPADSEIYASTVTTAAKSFDTIPEHSVQPLWWCDRMEDRF